jgi:ABC-type transport system substrate-binding protein
VRTPPSALALLLSACLAAGGLASGCGSSSSTASTGPADTAVNPGPNPTTGDPGPNNTANGPQTLQGTLVARSGCIELDGNAANEPAGRFQLEFSTEAVQRKGATVVLSGKDGTQNVGPHDILFVAGHPDAGSGSCGTRFLVDKVVAVTPG